ncbi:MAG: hypothetical protein KC619_30070 [Myxococcales bacterium]|nr:hypothetical protein [Myxococcales bacterium]
MCASAAEVLAALPVAVMVVGDDTLVRYANSRAASTLGAEVAMLLGRPVTELLGPPTAPLGEADRDERIVTAPNRHPRRIGYSERQVGRETVIVFRDISGTAELRRQRDKLMSLAAIGEALPSLLHELKNPLAAVTTSIEVLIEEQPDEDLRDFLYAILTELRRMKLGFEGIGAVHNEVRSPRSQAIDHACREACRVLSGRAAGVGVEFRCDVADLPLLPFDASVVRAILLNFVSNAIHACERGNAVRVEVRLTRDDVLQITVSDTGAGMSPDVLEKATELFFTTKPSGSGIGLALCRRAIEGAGGTLELTSVPGFGTTVQARIPVRSREA